VRLLFTALPADSHRLGARFLDAAELLVNHFFPRPLGRRLCEARRFSAAGSGILVGGTSWSRAFLLLPEPTRGTPRRHPTAARSGSGVTGAVECGAYVRQPGWPLVGEGSSRCVSALRGGGDSTRARDSVNSFLQPTLSRAPHAITRAPERARLSRSTFGGSLTQRRALEVSWSIDREGQARPWSASASGSPLRIGLGSLRKAAWLGRAMSTATARRARRRRNPVVVGRAHLSRRTFGVKREAHFCLQLCRGAWEPRREVLNPWKGRPSFDVRP
jgi:hypothetical protein